MLLIVDNGGEYIKVFVKFLSESSIPFKIITLKETLKPFILQKVKGLVLSGGNGDPFIRDDLSLNYKLLESLNVPTLGICLGHEIITLFFGGRIEKIRETGETFKGIGLINIHNKDTFLTKNLPDEVQLRRSHYVHVKELPSSFKCLGESDITKNEIIKHKDKPIWGFQCHPETLEGDGKTIIENFLNLCCKVWLRTPPPTVKEDEGSSKE